MFLLLRCSPWTCNERTKILETSGGIYFRHSCPSIDCIFLFNNFTGYIWTQFSWYKRERSSRLPLCHLSNCISISGFYFFIARFFKSSLGKLVQALNINLKRILSICALSFVLSVLIELLAGTILFDSTFSVNPHFQFESAMITGLITVLVASMYEELLYRGLILNSIFNKTQNIQISCIIVSLLFAFGHISSSKQAEFPIWAVANHFVWSYMISYLVLKTRMIDIGFGIHIAHNLIAYFTISKYDYTFFLRYLNGPAFYTLKILLEFSIW